MLILHGAGLTSSTFLSLGRVNKFPLLSLNRKGANHRSTEGISNHRSTKGRLNKRNLKRHGCIEFHQGPIFCDIYRNRLDRSFHPTISSSNFLRIEGKSFAQQVAEFFFQQGGKANTEFGEVLLDIDGVQNDKFHGIGRLKATSFASVKDVLENGVVILPMREHNVHNKKQKTGMIAAPIMIEGVRYICVVVVIDNNINKKLYVHEVSLHRNLLGTVISNWKAEEQPQTSHQGDIFTALLNYIRTHYTKGYILISA